MKLILINLFLFIIHSFELQKNDVNKTSYFSDGTTKFDVIDVDRQKYLGQVVATVI